jgi:hypothetical protein
MVAPPWVNGLVAVRGESSVRSAVAIGQGLWSSSEGRITIGNFCLGRPVGIRAALALKNRDHIEEDKMLQQDLSADVRAERTEFAEVPDVVVADDGGWGSRRALEQAAREAERRRARLVVVTVVVSSPVEPEGWAAWNRAERDAGGPRQSRQRGGPAPRS